MNPNDETFSKLTDGELTSGELNEALLSTLDDPAARDELKLHIQLRQANAAWREEMRGAEVAPVKQLRDFNYPRTHRIRYAAAACIVGVLVLSGVMGGLWMAPQNLNSCRHAPYVYPTVRVVTPEEQRDLTEAFALHESVAGPLAWYASDENEILVAPAEDKATLGEPVAVAMSFTGPTGKTRRVTMVCRAGRLTTIQLPAHGETPSMKLVLSPKPVNGDTQLRYAIAVDSPTNGQPLAVVTGQQDLRTKEIALGQLAFNDTHLNIRATAWAIR
jgi:hypothetical protein